jgi:hypothetical protein
MKRWLFFLQETYTIIITGRFQMDAILNIPNPMQCLPLSRLILFKIEETFSVLESRSWVFIQLKGQKGDDKQ